MTIAIDTIDLSMTDPATGEYRTANIYYVDGVNDATGAPRPLSIGQVVMALCLKRAAELEDRIVDVMSGMELISSQLEAMTEIENAIVDFFSDGSHGNSTFSLEDHTIANGEYAGTTYKDFLVAQELIASNIDNVYGGASTTPAGSITYTDFVTSIESKMDEKNSFSQQTMIELQSLTNKRDQAYDMISNVLKSLNTVLTGTVNNI
jgi:hypothetical protein